MTHDIDGFLGYMTQSRTSSNLHVWIMCHFFSLCCCRYDFFLVSQSVRQGTVTPTHFNVICDTSGLRPDHMQRLTYKLCHLYYNWPVSATSIYYLVSDMICRVNATKLWLWVCISSCNSASHSASQALDWLCSIVVSLQTFCES